MSKPSAVSGNVRLLPTLALLFGGLAIGLVSAPPASADCPGPSMTVSPQDVDRGGELTATGQAWGDNCYDTGPPPDGEGALGLPTSGIEIVLTQRDREWVLATVDADDEYSFEEQVVVPPDATPGDAQLTVRSSGAAPYLPTVEPTLRISAAPAIPAPPSTKPTPDPTTAESSTSTPSDANSTESGSIAPWLTAAAVVVALAVVASTVAIRRKSR